MSYVCVICNNHKGQIKKKINKMEQIKRKNLFAASGHRRHATNAGRVDPKPRSDGEPAACEVSPTARFGQICVQALQR